MNREDLLSRSQEPATSPLHARSGVILQKYHAISHNNEHGKKHDWVRHFFVQQSLPEVRNLTLNPDTNSGVMSEICVSAAGPPHLDVTGTARESFRQVLPHTHAGTVWLARSSLPAAAIVCRSVGTGHTEEELVGIRVANEFRALGRCMKHFHSTPATGLTCTCTLHRSNFRQL
jgi:hypothetical protein